MLMGTYLHLGIAMATTVSSWINAGMMAFILQKRGHFVFDDRLKRRLPRILIASAKRLLAIAWQGMGLFASAKSVASALRVIC